MQKLNYVGIIEDLIYNFDYSDLGKEHEPDKDTKEARVLDLIWHITDYLENHTSAYLVYCAPENYFRYINNLVFEPEMIYLDEVHISIPSNLKTKKAIAEVIAKKVKAARIIFPGIGK